MSLLSVIIAICVVGVVLWVINSYVPMEPSIKKILNIAVILILVVWLLQVSGLLGTLGGIGRDRSMRSLPNWKRSLGKFPKLVSRNRPASDMPEILVGGGTFGAGPGAEVAQASPPYVNPIPGSRRAFGTINDAFYADIPTYAAALAGDPAYELFVSTARQTTAQVNAWKAAFPGASQVGVADSAYVLAYLILVNLEAEPAPGSLYYDLVNAVGFPDLWVRRDSDGTKVLLSGFFGWYLWTKIAVEDFLIPWMQQSGALYDWFTKYDGFFLDNFPQVLGDGAWGAVVAAGGGAVTVDGVATTANDLATLYGTTSTEITANIKEVDSAVIIVRNAAAYEGTGDPILLGDSNSNGLLWEPVDNDTTIYANPGWVPPPIAMQFVNTNVEWLEIQGFDWTNPAASGYFFFFQNSAMPGRI